MNSLLCFFLLFVLSVASASNAEETYPIDPQLGFSTGPAIGEKIPQFELLDQNGVLRSINDLVGDNGALLNFYRSAAW